MMTRGEERDNQLEGERGFRIQRYRLRMRMMKVNRRRDENEIFHRQEI